MSMIIIIKHYNNVFSLSSFIPANKLTSYYVHPQIISLIHIYMEKMIYVLMIY